MDTLSASPAPDRAGLSAPFLQNLLSPAQDSGIVHVLVQDWELSATPVKGQGFQPCGPEGGGVGPQTRTGHIIPSLCLWVGVAGGLFPKSPVPGVQSRVGRLSGLHLGHQDRPLWGGAAWELCAP